MTWRQTLNIKQGYQQGIEREYDRGLLVARALTKYIGASFSGGADFKKIWPLTTEVDKTRLVKRNNLPIHLIKAVFKAAVSNER